MSLPGSFSEREILWPKTHLAAQMAAERYGINLGPRAAAQVARAVLECADDEYRVTGYIAREIEGPGALGELRKRLRRQAAIEVADAGLLPTALPRELIRRPLQPWELTEMRLIVPVRRPN